MRPTALLTALILLSACETEHEVSEPTEGNGRVMVLDAGGPEGDTGWWPSITFDLSGTPHISFCDAHAGDLRYATRQGNSWQVVSAVAEGSVGKYTAIAADSRGEVSIAYYDQGKKYLKFAHQDESGKWVSETVAWGLEVGMAAQLRFDKNDDPHIFYYVPSGKLAHAHKSDGEWHKKNITDATGGFSVRISAVERPDGFWLSFIHWSFKDTILKIGKPKSDGSWDLETVATRNGPGWWSQLVFVNDEPQVYFSESYKNRVMVAKKVDGDWETEVVVDQVNNFALAPRPDGKLILAYEDITNGAAGAGTVKYLLGSGQKWDRYYVEPEGPSGLYLAVDVDKNGRPLIAYYAGYMHSLKIYDETSPK